MSHHSSKVLSDSKSKVTFLPKLMDNKFQLSQNLLVENPFFVPPDSEIFQSKEKEKETRKEVIKQIN